MAKTILLSVMVAMVILPMLAARDLDPQRGLKRAIMRTSVFFVGYAIALQYFWSPFE